MSFFRAIFARHARELPDPAQCNSLEEFAFRLCMSGTDTAVAEKLLRDAQSRWEIESLVNPARDAEKPAERLLARADSAALAAKLLLRRVAPEVYEEDARDLYGGENQAPALDFYKPDVSRAPSPESTFRSRYGPWPA